MLFIILIVLVWVIIYRNISNGRIEVDDWQDWALVISFIIAFLAPLKLIYISPNEWIEANKQKIYPISIDTGKTFLIQTTDNNSYWYFVEKTEAPVCQSIKHQNVIIEYLPPGVTSAYFLEKRKHFKNKALDLLFNYPAWHRPQIIFQIPPGGIAQVPR